MKFTTKPENWSDTNKLLWLILQELKKMNTPKESVCSTRESIEKPKSKKAITCKVCGEKFDNRGLFLRHMKVHKEGN